MSESIVRKNKNMSPRLRFLSRFLAVWLVVLIAAASTAPVRTWDLFAPADGVRVHDSLEGHKLSKQTTAPAIMFYALAVSPAVVVRVNQCSAGTFGHQVLPTVLRL
jgi:hypothetical protein